MGAHDHVSRILTPHFISVKKRNKAEDEMKPSYNRRHKSVSTSKPLEEKLVKEEPA